MGLSCSGVLNPSQKGVCDSVAPRETAVPKLSFLDRENAKPDTIIMPTSPAGWLDQYVFYIYYG